MVKEDGIEKYMSTAKFVFLISMQKKDRTFVRKISRSKNRLSPTRFNSLLTIITKHWWPHSAVVRTRVEHAGPSFSLSAYHFMTSCLSPLSEEGCNYISAASGSSSVEGNAACSKEELWHFFYLCSGSPKNPNQAVITPKRWRQRSPSVRLSGTVFFVFFSSSPVSKAHF